jgi:hypothetical protein
MAKTLPVSSQSFQLHAHMLLQLVVLTEWSLNVPLDFPLVASLISGLVPRIKKRQFLTTLVNWARSGKVCTTPMDEVFQTSRPKDKDSR